MTVTRSAAVHPALVSLVPRRLVDLIHDEAERMCEPLRLDRAGAQLLSALVIESLEFRQDEWRARRIDPTAVTLPEVLDEVRGSLARVLSHAARAVQLEGRATVLLVDVVGAAAVQQCKIWPLCKPQAKTSE